MRTLIYALAGAVSLLLIIACVNGRTCSSRDAWSRRGDRASSALGASRKDIFRQLFLEGLLLAFGAGLSVPRWRCDRPRFMA
jgi:hypothetical protein